MAKATIQYVCQECGSVFAGWAGQCTVCQAWNSLTEEIISKNNKFNNGSKIQKSEPISISEVVFQKLPRLSSGIDEFDRVLGKGFVSGAIVLLGGEPGIGKSTLALQVGQKIARSGKIVLYISGEESVNQVSLRAKRLGELSEHLLVYAETNIIQITKTIKHLKPDIVILDSIQVVYHPELPSSVGTINQVRQCASELINVIKDIDSIAIVIGHITKDGQLAGPKVLEHLVDVILYLEGERNQKYRLLRCFKNRYFATTEIGIFEMIQKGLKEIPQPSELFIDEQTLLSPGSMVAGVMHGSRVILVEVQALVVHSGYGMAKRTFAGVDSNRANLIIATLEKKNGLKLSQKDIFLNVIGGLKITEPALDLAIALAIVSSLYDRPIGDKIGVIGELGLTGEIRSVSNIDKRVNEFIKMGFKKIMVPKQNKVEKLFTHDSIIYVDNIKKAISIFMNRERK